FEGKATTGGGTDATVATTETGFGGIAAATGETTGLEATGVGVTGVIGTMGLVSWAETLFKLSGILFCSGISIQTYKHKNI
ncbi:MAG: hypothetical protein AAB956_00555, partial [Patescibacteria group bacterium]